MKSEFVMNGGVEEGWDEYISTLQKYGLNEYLEIMQKNLDSYNENMAK